jgi:hypothetical protein
MSWSLSELLRGLHRDIEQRLKTAREAFAHSGTKGDASENVWRQLLREYLPQRYQCEAAHIVDSNNQFSEQIDVVVFDRQYSPLMFNYEGQKIIPAESVYAAFEAKQTINAKLVTYARQKIASVRKLHRTSLPIPYAAGTYAPKPLPHIIGGVLTFESDWNPPLGQPLNEALAGGDADSRLDLGCVAAHGIFQCDESACYAVTPGGSPAAAFLLELITRLQVSATVPMIDVRAYTRWLPTDSGNTKRSGGD